jgi:hypothetical protein
VQLEACQTELFVEGECGARLAEGVQEELVGWAIDGAGRGWATAGFLAVGEGRLARQRFRAHAGNVREAGTRRGVRLGRHLGWDRGPTKGRATST